MSTDYAAELYRLLPGGIPHIAIAAREAAGLKQEDIAERMGLSRSRIAAIETGRAPFDQRCVRAYAEACGVDADVLELDVTLQRAS